MIANPDSPDRCSCGAVALVAFALVKVATGETIEHGPVFLGCGDTTCTKRRRASFKASHRAKLLLPEGSVTVRVRTIERDEVSAAAAALRSSPIEGAKIGRMPVHHSAGRKRARVTPVPCPPRGAVPSSS